MSVPQVEIQLIAVVVAVACALPGVFLMLRRMSLMSDAISHAVLLGIVLAFFVTKDLTSPLLLVAATLTGVVTVTLVELLNRTRLVREDAAIGLVFPALFSVGVILVSRYAGSVHLDTDAVLLGELAFAPFDRFVFLGNDLGPRTLYVMGGILLIDAIFIAVFYKELKLATFDAGLAAALGFSPALVHYALMAMVSVTAVGAFDAVGSVLVVALVIGPAASAYLLADRLSRVLALAAVIGVASAICGYWLAHALDASIAGSMATMVGVFFGLTLLFAPERGLLANVRRHWRQRRDFADTMLAIHVFNHEALPEATVENRVEHLSESLKWPPAIARGVVKRAQQRGIVLLDSDGQLHLTGRGRNLARQVLAGVE